MSDIAIKVENISKRYRIGLKEETKDTFLGAMGSILRSPLGNLKKLKKLTKFQDDNKEHEDIIWALKDVSFEVKKGEVIGIIGANGAGKSTLLKILAQITHPTSGRVELNGRVASLLEVGTGFHSELTGRENIYLNGTILGMTKKEINRKMDEIIEFSGVEKFIDTPVKKYSSGMGVRLAFSVAAHLEPEILLIDEVLAVGDAEFQKKCLGKMDEVARQGRTVLFVSHGMTAVKTLCERGILLWQGQLLFDGNITDTIRTYIRESLETFVLSKLFNITKNNITFKKVSISKEEIYSGDAFELEFSFNKTDTLDYRFDITFHLIDEYGHLVFVGSTGKSNASGYKGNGLICAICKIPKNLMNEGVYTIFRLLFVKNKGTVLNEIQNCFSFRILPKKQKLGWMGEREEGIVDPKLAWNIQIN
jgi:lipopolysaccharide transport system ATP-binding protein